MQSNSRLQQWLDAVIEAGWLAALTLAPLFFNVFSSRVFEPDKISLLRSIALVMLLAWLVKVADGGAAWLPAYAPDEKAKTGTEGEGASEDAVEHRSLLRRILGIPLLLPVLLLLVAYLISTSFSVARFVSWWGSYQRLQGTYTFLSYLIIAVLTAAHLRRPDQIRRLQHVIVAVSMPISIYGIIQHNRIDPLPWGGDTSTRVAANAGNAIFLAAYLIMAFFFTLERVYSSFAYLLGYKPAHLTDTQDAPTAFAGGAYMFVLFAQLLAIFWTQSRGPWLGLLLGLYVFVLLLFTALRPKNHRLWTGLWVGTGLAGAIALIVINVTPIAAGLQDVPYLGRMTTLLESESGTGRVRVLIWDGASRMVQPHEALLFPDGSRDVVNPLRPLVGYGPEAMWIAYNPFYPPELAHVEARNASPDRAHNETWDSLVITGLLGFLAYMSLFVAIFYWSLRWLHLLVNRRDALLFGGLQLVFAIVMVAVFYVYDEGSWRFLGVALPLGMIVGLGAYVTLAAFLHPRPEESQRGDLPRQLLLITIIATIIAHFVEIHFGIAIAATRTYFWILSALLLVVGMRWATPEMYATVQEMAEEPEAAAEPPSERNGGRGGRGRRRDRRPARVSAARMLERLPSLPTTLASDALMFLTLVYIYTTNGRGLTSPFGVFFGAVFQRTDRSGELYSDAPIFFLVLFTWGVAATIGMVAESLRQRRAPGLGWWVRGYLLHALVTWGLWLIYGGIQGARLVPGAAGGDLDSQLDLVAGHFALFTWIVVAWILAAGTMYAWPWLRERRLAGAGRAALSLGVGAVAAVAMFAIVSSVNIALVRADVIYKQGQSFDSRGEWPSSIELYRRALAARRTEDHYMLFLGRALLEQAKARTEEGTASFPENPTLDDVLNLDQQTIGQLGRTQLLRAAEAVLLEAQRVNPLNTDHTANLARLYRSWSDLSPNDPVARQEMLDKSIEMYDMAVQLSPNAAHLWNEKGNTHLAREERDLAEAAYLHSLALDPRYEQTYLLLADFYDRAGQDDEAIELLKEGVELVARHRSAQLYSFLGVAMARTGDMEGAIDANLNVLELQPSNVAAMRNLALLYRDMGDVETAIEYTERALALTGANNASEAKTLHQLAAQLYQQQDRTDKIVEHYEQIRQIDPNDAAALQTLYNLYTAQQEWNKAVEVLQSLATLEPTNFQHPLAIAQILQQVGQTENALTFANQAMELAPEEQKPAIAQLIAMLSPGS